MDLKKVADETKVELPQILKDIPSFNAAKSSAHNLRDLLPLAANNCPGFVLPDGDVEAGKKGTRIRVFDMDTFDVALQLDPDYKVHTHLSMSNSAKSTATTLSDSTTELENMIDKTELDDHDTNMQDNHRNDGGYIEPTKRMISSTPKPTASFPTSPPRPPRGLPVLVLNLASERSPGGGWQNGALAQEECLCYRSSLYLSLHKRHYPLPSQTAIYTPSVLLLRSSMATGHALLTPATAVPDLPVTSVLSLAALRKPQLSSDRTRFSNEGQRAETKRKIRLTLRVAAGMGHTKLVLGALGCGVFANPPREVARCFLEVLRETEFTGGWWEEVAFAVLDNVKGPDGGKDGKGNFGVFYQALNGWIV